MVDYQNSAKLFKVMSDATRLQILDILSCGTLCACDILDGLKISQSTLSHHMKVLIEFELVVAKKESTWMFYSLNQETVIKLHKVIDEIVMVKEDCICKELSSEGQ